MAQPLPDCDTHGIMRSDGTQWCYYHKRDTRECAIIALRSSIEDFIKFYDDWPNLSAQVSDFRQVLERTKLS